MRTGRARSAGRPRPPSHQPLGAHPVADEVGDRDHQQLVLPSRTSSARDARHAAVAAHDLADDAGRVQAGDARQVHGRLGLAGAHQHAAVTRAQREDVARAAPGRRARVFGIDGPATVRAIGGRDAGGRALLGLDRRRTRSRTCVEFCCAGTCSGISSSSSRSPVIGMQMRPRPCVAMKLIASGVTFSAAIVRSPSFSRSSSSTTMSISPRGRRPRPRSIGANGPLAGGARRRSGGGIASGALRVMMIGSRARAARTCRACRIRG
jgi:hypothetical protein